MKKGKDPHAKRRLADGRNSWRKMELTEGAREEFVSWLLENGLRDVVRFQTEIVSSFVEVSK